MSSWPNAAITVHNEAVKKIIISKSVFQGTPLFLKSHPSLIFHLYPCAVESHGLTTVKNVVETGTGLLHTAQWSSLLEEPSVLPSLLRNTTLMNPGCKSNPSPFRHPNTHWSFPRWSQHSEETKTEPQTHLQLLRRNDSMASHRGPRTRFLNNCRVQGSDPLLVFYLSLLGLSNKFLGFACRH